MVRGGSRQLFVSSVPKKKQPGHETDKKRSVGQIFSHDVSAQLSVSAGGKQETLTHTQKTTRWRRTTAHTRGGWGGVVGVGGVSDVCLYQ